MKKFITAVFVACISLAAYAANPVPMVDVSVAAGAVSSMRTALPSDFQDAVRQSYVAAMNHEINSNAAGSLDIIAVGPRAEVVITDYYDPADFQTQRQEEFKRNEAGNSGHYGHISGYPGTVERLNSFRQEPARVMGYVVYKGQKLRFDIPAKLSSSVSNSDELANALGNEAFQLVLSL